MSHNLLETLIREVGEDWLIDSFSPAHEAIARLQARLEKANAAAHTRLGANAPSLLPHALEAECKRNPHKVKAFLQALGSSESPDMLVMVWRVLMGCSIAEIQAEYELKKRFSLRVRLQNDRNLPEVYASDDINDAALLRHFGIMSMDGSPIFDGFYPL